MQEFDLVVIGGGSAGLKAARTAARLGRTVALAEERELGGECFWGGCVPTKAMVRAAQVWNLVRNSAMFGIHAAVTEANFAEAMAYKERVLRTVGGDGPADGGLSKLGAAYFHTRARFEGPHDVRVGDTVVRGKNILLATGTVPAIPSIPGLVESGFITNREAVNLQSLPKRIVVIGGGPIGLEFAQVFHRFGAEVTVVESSEQILPREDRDISDLAALFLEQEGVALRTASAVTRVARVGAEKRVTVRSNGISVHGAGHAGNADLEIACDEILVATGRIAAVDGMNIESAGLGFDGREVTVDSYLRTNVPHILAAGDVSGGFLFTHVASHEGKLAAMNAFTDKPEPFDPRVVPRCTYIDPEVASIGLTEQQARDQGHRIIAPTFSFEHLDRAIIHGDARGIVKLVVDELDGQILGGHLVGPDASSILSELAVCMRNHLPVSAIAETMHAYPSFPEAVEAAALCAPNYRGQVEGATSDN